MTKVITYGTFDLLHQGHLNLLKRIKSFGDYLIIGLSTDKFNLEEKNKRSYFPYEKRRQILEATGYPNLIIPEENWDQKKEDIRKYMIDIFVIGDDWSGKFDYLKKETRAKVIYLPRTPGISTTLIKEKNAQKEQIKKIKILEKKIDKENKKRGNCPS